MAEITAVRAWGEYDEWSVYCECDERAAGDDALFGRHPWSRTAIPKTGAGAKKFSMLLDGVVDCLTRLPDVVAEWGPLRSLRVLLSNALTVQMNWDQRMSDVWVWSIWRTGEPEMRGALEFGSFVGETDSANVQRALDAAIAWLTEAAS